MCMIQDSERFEVWRNTVRRAQKEHTCCECLRMIQPGESYHIEAGLLDGHWDDSKTCAHCYRAGSWLLTVCGGHLLAYVHEELQDHWDEDPGYHSMWLGRALVGIRHDWRKKDGTLMPLLPEFTKEMAHAAGLEHY